MSAALLVCALCPVTVIDISELEENQVSEDTVQSWCVEEQAMDMDIGVLQQVEELEHKVTSASLQVKVGNLNLINIYAYMRVNILTLINPYINSIMSGFTGLTMSLF